MKKQLIAIASFLLTLTPLAANAQYDSPHKWTDSFGKTRIYIPGTADNVVDVLTESSKEYTFIVNTCGWISLRESATRKIKSFSTPTNSISINNFIPSFSFYHGPLCSWVVSSSWNYWDKDNHYTGTGLQVPNGSLHTIFNTNQFFIKIAPLYSAPSSIQGTLTYENTIKNKINSCGFGTILVSTTRPMTTFKIAGVDYTLDTLPAVDKPQLCKIQGASKVRYLPLN